MDDSTTVYFCVDVETRGDSARHNGIVSIGAAVKQGDNTVQQRWDLLPLPGQDFERRCLDEFWHKNDEMRELLRRLTANAGDPLEGIRSFRRFLDQFENPVILSDNVGFDTQFINYYLDLADLPSMRYDATRTKYRPSL
jgi:DNA polymerase III alpha subunit (gram-positive type)